MSIFNQLLGGLSGGFTGLAQQRQVRQQDARLKLQDDRQRTADLEHQQDRARTSERDQILGQHLRPALQGDQTAQSEVIRVAPELAARFVSPPTAPPVPRTQYDADRGAIVDLDKGTAAPVPGLQPKPKEPITGTPEWREALKDRARIAADFRPERQTQPRPPNEFASKAALVYQRAADAASVLEPFFKTGAPIKSLAGRVPIVGNFVLSDDEQRMNQAAETVASAILRLESGAAITKDEIRSYTKQFLPSPGEGDAVRAQKREILHTQLERIRQAAQPATDRDVPSNQEPQELSRGNINLGGGLTAAQKRRAATDPQYAAFLKATGKM